MGSKTDSDVEKEDFSALNLYQKLAALSAEIGAVEKDGVAPAQMGGFKFISHGRLMAELRDRQHRYGIWVKPEVITTSESRVSGSNKEGIRIAGEFRFTIINADKPAEREECIWSGEGIDYGDKATQKAATSAHKYFLMKVYNVSDKDDNDGVAVESGNARRTTSTRIETPEPSTEAQSSEPADDEDWAGLRILARSLPKDKGAPSWFDAKIGAKVRQHGGGNVGVSKVLEELLLEHEKFCGPDCEHVKLDQ